MKFFLQSIFLICSMLTSLLFAEVKRPKYFIAIKRNGKGSLDQLEDFIPLLPPKNKFYADPMLFKYNGLNYLFFEDYDYKKGIISYVKIQEDSISETKVALELPIHLSFPYIFQEEDKIYMTPETYDYKSVSLFVCDRFPDLWSYKRTLIYGQHFSDPILFKHGGYYWLFTAVQGDRLAIYYADNLESEFKPHPINSRYIRGRNAGGVFYINDHFIRPTMDCRLGYGKSIVWKEITLLHPKSFIEKEVLRIEPNWAPGLQGTHSFSQSEDYIAYDGYRMIFSYEDALYSSD